MTALGGILPRFTFKAAMAEKLDIEVGAHLPTTDAASLALLSLERVHLGA